MFLIDYMTERMPFYTEARKTVDLCAESVIDGCIAAHSITDSFYIMRRYSQDERRELLSQMCDVMSVVGIDGIKLNAAVKNLNFDDIEDCLQSVCAEDCGAEYIITRNFKDFECGKVPPIAPGEFLSRLNDNVNG